MRYLFCVLAALAAAVSVVAADVVELTDGSRLVGEVRRLADGKLLVTTSFAGKLTLDASLVVGVTTDRPVYVQLPDGRQLHGPLSYDASDGQVLGDCSERMTAGELAGLWVDPADSPEMLRLAKEEQKGSWGAKFDFGLNGQAGSKEKTAFNGGVETEYTADRNRMLYYLRGRYAREEGERSVNELLGGADLEADISDHWFAFGQGELETDEFEDLDLRTTLTGGVGRFLIRRDVETLTLQGGFGYQHEMYDGGDERTDPIGKMGLDYERKIAAWLDFLHTTEYFQSLSESDQYRIISNTRGEIPLSDNDPWRIAFGFRCQYNAVPEGDSERLDTFYFINFVLDLD